MVQFQVESIDLTEEWNTTSHLMKVPRVPLRMDTSEVVDYLPVLKTRTKESNMDANGNS